MTKEKTKWVTIQIQLDNETYEYLKKASSETGNSISSIVRFILWQYLQVENANKTNRIN